MSIDKLTPESLNCNIFSVYDYDSYTIQELLCKFFEKINNCIDISNATFELSKWLVNEGLNQEVVKQLMIWLHDGTLEKIINENIFKDLNNKINGVNTSLTEKIENIVTADVSDFDNLQDAHDHVVKRGGGILNISKDVSIDKTFKWDIRRVIINGNGHTLTYSNSDKSTYAIQTISSETGSHPYNQVTTSLNALKIHANRCKGILFEESGYGKEISHITINRCEISDCGIGIQFGNNSYLVQFRDTDIYNCDQACLFPDGLTNAGENINFVGCAIYNNLCGFEIHSGVCDFFFTQCSFDFNEKYEVIALHNSKAFATNCHFEHDASKFSDRVPFGVYGDSGTLAITNSLIMFSNTANKQMQYIFGTDGNHPKIMITSCFLFGWRTTTRWICGGTGQLVVKNCNVNIVPECDFRISPNTTQCAVGTMTTNTFTDLFITDDSDPVTTVTQTGTNIKIAYDFNLNMKFGRSIKINKTFGGGSAAAFIVLAPIDRNSVNNMELMVKKTSGSGNVFYTFGYCNRDGLNMVKKELGTVTKNYATNETDWESIEKFMTNAPAWATHMYCEVNLNGATGIQLNIGEITANSY